MTSIALVGTAIIAIAALLAGWLVKRRPIEQDTLVKTVLFGLYFWGLVFLQLIFAALAYRFIKP